jgi:hypothetical protein
MRSAKSKPPNEFDVAPVTKTAGSDTRVLLPKCWTIQQAHTTLLFELWRVGSAF